MGRGTRGLGAHHSSAIEKEGEYVPVDYGDFTVNDPALQEAFEALSNETGLTVKVTNLAAFISVEGLTQKEISEAAARTKKFSGIGHYEDGRTQVDAIGGSSTSRWQFDLNGTVTAWSKQDQVFDQDTPDS